MWHQMSSDARPVQDGRGGRSQDLQLFFRVVATMSEQLPRERRQSSPIARRAHARDKVSQQIQQTLLVVQVLRGPDKRVGSGTSAKLVVAPPPPMLTYRPNSLLTPRDP